MKSIGTKSIAIGGLTALSLGVAIHADRLRPEELQSLSPQTLFCIGFFTILVGFWFFGFWSLGIHSHSYLRVETRGSRLEGESALLEWGNFALLVGRENLEAPSEFSTFVMRIFSFVICFCAALICFDSGTVEHMFAISGKLSHAGVRFCSEEKPEAIQTEEKRPGCELIYRAFELGYAKSLGSCASKKKEEGNLELCNLRQYDEPILHFTWRVLADVLDHFRETVMAPGLGARMQETFERQLQHSDALLGKLVNVIKSAPKASHHIFTNLPYPNGKWDYYRERLFEPRDCFTRYQKLPHMIEVSTRDAHGESQVLDYIYGQMLFNPAYAQAAGDCQEYTIHWNSPEDSCDRLAQNPEGFLKSQGALGLVKVVLNRMVQQSEFSIMQFQLKFLSIPGMGRPLPPPPADATKVAVKTKADISADTIVSFQCIMRADKPTEAKVRRIPFKLYGHDFEASDIHFSRSADSGPIPVAMYKVFSQAMAENFHYVGYLSHEDMGSMLQWTVGPELFNEGDYPLTRLEYLKGVDIFLGHDWLQNRSDLLQVYPYYYHLYNFIELFRTQYDLQRTRL